MICLPTFDKCLILCNRFSALQGSSLYIYIYLKTHTNTIIRTYTTMVRLIAMMHETFFVITIKRTVCMANHHFYSQHFILGVYRNDTIKTIVCARDTPVSVCNLLVWVHANYFKKIIKKTYLLTQAVLESDRWSSAVLGRKMSYTKILSPFKCKFHANKLK